MDMSLFYDKPRDGFQSRGWIITELMSPTMVAGNCVQFYYALAGLNAESLRLIRVDIDTKGLVDNEQGSNNQTLNIPTIPTVPTENVANTQEVFTKSIEASLSFNSGVVEVKLNEILLNFQTCCQGPRCLGILREIG